MLRFLGRGSAFTEQQNSAFFTDGGDLVLIDCAMSAFHRLKALDPFELVKPCALRRIYVIVTHTHGDHVSGIPMLIHYAYYIWHIPVTVAAANDAVAKDLLYLIDVLDGCDADGYSIVKASSDEIRWVKDIIPTEHSPSLSGKCFGYRLEIYGREIVYTGDTNTLEPFLPYIGKNTEFYCEISAGRSPVHLFFDDVCSTLMKLAENGTEVYLMHLDNEEKIRELIKGTSLKIARLAGE